MNAVTGRNNAIVQSCYWTFRGYMVLFIFPHQNIPRLLVEARVKVLVLSGEQHSNVRSSTSSSLSLI